MVFWLPLLLVLSLFLTTGCSDDDDDGNSSNSDQFAEAPNITNQPTAQTVLTGRTVTLVVQAAGSELSFQWQFASAANQSFADIPGANQTVHTIINVTANDAGMYRCRITNNLGTIFTDPAEVIINLLAAPTITNINPNVGSIAGGTNITITGTNFVLPITVTIGGSNVTNLNLVSSTQITATTPAGAGSQDVVVTNTTANTTLAGGFTYLNLPTITQITPNQGPTTGNTSITITGTNFFAGNTSVTVGGVNATAVNVTSPTQLTASTPISTNGAKNVVITTPGGNTTSGGGFIYGLPGTLAFAKSARGAGLNFNQGRSIAALADGSFLITGFFEGTAKFGAGEANETDLVSAGSNDIFIAKYNPNGILVFAKSAGGTGSDQGLGIAVLTDGSSFVTGFFQSTAKFGAGEANETDLVSVGNQDIFIAKFNPNGSLAFAKSAGGISRDFGNSVAVLPDGSSFVTGFFSGTTKFGAGEANETDLVSAGGLDDIFIAKYNPNGSLSFAKRAGGTAPDRGSSIAVLADGSSFVTGDFSGTAKFGAGEANETDLASAGFSDIFIAKYNPNGTLAFAKRAGGASSDLGTSVSVLPDGSSFVTGSFALTAKFGPGEPNETDLVAGGSDIFIAKYNSDGTLAFAKRAGGTGSDLGFGIAVLPDGSSFVTGQFSGTAKFGPGELNETDLVSAGSEDIFIAKYNPNGTLSFAKKAGSTNIDSGSGVAVLADGSSFVTGSFRDTAKFGPGEPNETDLVSTGFQDIFIAKFH